MATMANDKAEQQQAPPSKKPDGLPARIVSSSIGSCLTALAVTPLQVAKVRLQNSSGGVEAVVGGVSSASRSRGAATASRVVPSNRNVVLVSLARNSVQKCGCDAAVLPSVQAAAVASSTSSASATTSSQLGTVSMMRRIFETEGYSGLYKGLRPTLIMAIPNTVLYFSSYDEISWRLRNYYNIQTRCSSSSSPVASSASSEPSWIPCVAGGSARLLASTATAPLEYIRTREASIIGPGSSSFSTTIRSSSSSSIGSGVEKGTMSQIQALMRAAQGAERSCVAGAKALFRGLGPTLLRDVPFSAIYWYCIESFRQAWKDHRLASSNTTKEYPHVVSPLEQAAQAFVNGAAAGLIAASVTTPADVVKTRLQAASSPMSSSSSSKRIVQCSHGNLWSVICTRPPPSSNNINSPSSMGTFSMLREIAVNEGIRGLWRGNQARMIQVVPACAIMISSYEFGKRLLEE